MSGPAGGFRGYIQNIRLFSRNARLYMLHIVGMDMIVGTWGVIFNLYLLAAGFSVEFIGLRILIASVASAFASIPAGLISDRIGRKWSFILGDGMGALMSLINIFTLNRTVLLITPVVEAVFGNLHHVSEPAFMAENSRSRERVHLFSVSSGLRTAAAMAGSLIVVTMPHLQEALGWEQIALYRAATVLPIIGWSLSLLPAVLLRELPPEEKEGYEPPAPHQAPRKGLLALFGQVRNPHLVARVVSTNVLIRLGAAFTLPLMNVFFYEGLHAHAHEIGITFSLGSATLALSVLFAPFVAERLGKVQAVFWTRLLAVPFILLIGFSSDLESNLAPALTLAGLAYVLRTIFQNIGNPVAEAFTMEILHPQERATAVGVQMALGALVGGIATFASSHLMAAGLWQMPFLLMAAAYLASTLLWWVFFRSRATRPALA